MLWSIKINSKLHYCCLLCNYLVRIWLAAADDKGCRCGHHCCWRMSQNSINIEFSRNKFISTLIYGIYWIASMAASERTCARLPTPQAAWVHQIHATGGVSNFTTMVMVFGRWFAPLARNPLLLLDTNVAPTTDKTIGKIKSLPHPCSRGCTGEFLK